MAITLSSEIKALLDGANFAHLATVMADGSPQNAPVWVGREGDRILICTGEGSLKAKNTRRARPPLQPQPRCVGLQLKRLHSPDQSALTSG